MVGTYRGFSSHQLQRSKNGMVVGTELIVLDLLNFIFTAKRSRRRMPDYGTNIPSLTFQPLDQIIIDDVRDDLERAVKYDPRLALVSINIEPDYDKHQLQAAVTVRFVEMDVMETVNLDIPVGQ